MAIKWRVSDAKRLANAVRQYNAKLTRAVKKQPALAPYLPPRVNVQQIRSTLVSRNDFNREVSRLERIMRSDALELKALPGGAVTTKYEYAILRADVQRINRLRTNIVRRAGISTATGTMGSIASNNLKPKKFNLTGDQKAWEAQRKSIRNQSRGNYLIESQALYKDNYLKRVNNIIEDIVFFDPGYTVSNNAVTNSLERLRSLVAGLDPEIVFQAGLVDAPLSLDFLYTGGAFDSDYVDSIFSRWEDYLRGV